MISFVPNGVSKKMKDDFLGDIEQAVPVLQRGGVILYPTDTIWGLGCDATNKTAVAKIFDIKKRNPNKSMIMLVSDVEMIHRFVDNPSQQLIDEMMTAQTPTTGIFANARRLAGNLVHQDGSIGIRIASDTFCRELISVFGYPIVSTSANISSAASPQNFSEINGELISEVDYTAFYRRDDISKKLPSHIIRINESGELERIR